MLENEYYYELKYVYKDKVVSMKFNGEKTLNQIVENIQDFLKSAGWREDSIKEYIKTDEDIANEQSKTSDDEEDYKKYHLE